MSINYYHQVCGTSTTTSRLARGGCGTLTMAGHWAGHNWLSKVDQDTCTTPLVQREWKILRELQATGLVPVVSSVSPHINGGAMHIQCIDNAASLVDYVQAYLDGLIPIEVLRDILTLVVTAVTTFHSLGWVHNDLHDGNIVVGHGQHTWEVYIIDVAMATRAEGDVPEALAEAFSIANLASEDWYFLKWSIMAEAEECEDKERERELQRLVDELIPE
jgi:tRNA A-37 threonylcarbamoyl transferase component Bud32